MDRRTRRPAGRSGRGASVGLPARDADDPVTRARPPRDRETHGTVEEVVYYGDMTYYDVKLDGVGHAGAPVDAQRAGPPGAGHRHADPRGLEPGRAGAVPLRLAARVSSARKPRRCVTCRRQCVRTEPFRGLHCGRVSASGGQQAEAAQVDADARLPAGLRAGRGCGRRARRG